MKAKYENTLEYGKNISKWLVLFSAILAIASLLLFPAGSAQQLILLVGSVVCFVAAIVVIVKYCRCPYCGKMIITGVLVVTHCPSCRRDLKTGKKSKNKK